MTVSKKVGAQEDEKKFDREKKVLEEHIALVKEKLNSAKKDVIRAQAHVDKLRDANVVVEPSALEEIERVRQMIPHHTPAPRC